MKQHYSLILLLIGFFSISCQNDLGIDTDLKIDPPFINSVEFSHSLLNLDSDTTGNVVRLPSNRYQIKVAANGSVHQQIPDKNLKGTIKVFKPNSNSVYKRFYFNIDSVNSNNSSFSCQIVLDIERADIGYIRYAFSLQTGTGRMSNTVEKSLLVTRYNSRPNILNLSVPDSILRPVDGYRLIPFCVTASDSDGYSDIDEVFMKRIYPTETANILLYDDGNDLKNGDQIAGDGIFSRLVTIDSTAILGDQKFVFLVKDKSGAISDSSFKIITIH